VNREFELLVPIINHAVTEFELYDVMNPFAKMTFGKATLEEKGRSGEVGLPFDDGTFVAITRRILTSARAPLPDIWCLLAGTGCRLGEIAGLEVQDVVVDHEYPHLRIQPNSIRRLKTPSSERYAPLIGQSLEVAQRLVKGVSATAPVFPRYAIDNGANHLSAALMKHVRAITSEAMHNNHSLRHTMKGKLAEAGVAKNVQDLLLGHAPRDIGDKHYLGLDSRLKIFTEALRKVG